MCVRERVCVCARGHQIQERLVDLPLSNVSLANGNGSRGRLCCSLASDPRTARSPGLMFLGQGFGEREREREGERVRGGEREREKRERPSDPGTAR